MLVSSSSFELHPTGTFQAEIRTREYKSFKAAENRMENLLNALVDNILPAEAIQTKYGSEENKARQLQQ